MTSIGPHDEARRRLLVRALAGGWFGAALIGRDAGAAGPFGGRPEKLPPGQSVYRITGRVLIDGQPAAADSHIAANATLDTAPGGELIFVVGDAAMLMREDSRVTLEGEGGDAIRSVRLLKGRLLSVFGGGARRLATPAATIAISGTGVYMEARPEETYFCTCYGVSEVRAVDDPSSRTTVAATHHDRPLFIARAGEPGSLIRTAPFIDHTDQELMLIETLVGRTPPFVFPGSQYERPRSRDIYRR